VKVQILSVDLERRRIGLSMRRLTPQPWEVISQTYEVGQVVRGRITKLVNFVAFARLEVDGVEGLIHISELSDKRVTHPKEVVNEGEEYELRIIRIDTDKRRMGLSLKQALPKEQTLDWQIAPSDEHVEANGAVVNGQHAEFAN
jgi:small subunit ribosomal protein S1